MPDNNQLPEIMVSMTGGCLDGSDEIHAYVDNDGPDRDQLKLSLVTPGMTVMLQMTAQDVKRFMDVLTEQRDRLFELFPDMRCPACWMTYEEASTHGDHMHCRAFPYFPGEHGKNTVTKP